MVRKLTRIAATGLTGMVLGLSLASCTFDTRMASAAQSEATSDSQEVRFVTPSASVDPADQQVLFWNESQRAVRFRDMESWFAGREVPAAPITRKLDRGLPLSTGLQDDIRAYMTRYNAAGFMVVQNGKVRFEEYGLGMTAQDRWTSFSVAKSFTSTLLGAAIKDGKIASLADSVAVYIPEMVGTPYEDVTVRQLATMTSGVKWNENYADPDSDVARMASIPVAPGEDQIVNQMKVLPRGAPAGEKWVYKTGETNLLGVLVERATGISLAQYAKTAIVDPAGFEGDMFWMTGQGSRNIGGCCLSLRLSDYARMGLFALDGGMGSVPEGWFADATTAQVKFGDKGAGYGYQWWTYDGGNWGAQGIFGQAITVMPESDLVIAIISNWPSATNNDARISGRAIAARIAALE